MIKGLRRSLLLNPLLRSTKPRQQGTLPAHGKPLSKMGAGERRLIAPPPRAEADALERFFRSLPSQCTVSWQELEAGGIKLLISMAMLERFEIALQRPEVRLMLAGSQRLSVHSIVCTADGNASIQSSCSMKQLRRLKTGTTLGLQRAVTSRDGREAIVKRLMVTACASRRRFFGAPKPT